MFNAPLNFSNQGLQISGNDLSEYRMVEGAPLQGSHTNPPTFTHPAMTRVALPGAFQDAPPGLTPAARFGEPARRQRVDSSDEDTRRRAPEQSSSRSTSARSSRLPRRERTFATTEQLQAWNDIQVANWGRARPHGMARLLHETRLDPNHILGNLTYSYLSKQKVPYHPSYSPIGALRAPALAIHHRISNDQIALLTALFERTQCQLKPDEYELEITRNPHLYPQLQDINVPAIILCLRNYRDSLEMPETFAGTGPTSRSEIGRTYARGISNSIPVVDVSAVPSAVSCAVSSAASSEPPPAQVPADLADVPEHQAECNVQGDAPIDTSNDFFYQWDDDTLIPLQLPALIFTDEDIERLMGPDWTSTPLTTLNTAPAWDWASDTPL